MRKNILKLNNLFKKFLLQNHGIKQKIFKNTFWLTLTEGISKLLAIFITILITRYLGVNTYGIFSFAFAYTALYVILVDFGFNTLTTRELAKDDKNTNNYISNIIVSKIVISIIIYLLLIFSMKILNKDTTTQSLVYIVGVFTILQSFFYFFHSVFRAFEKMEYEALTRILYTLILAVGVVLNVIFKQSPNEIALSYFYAVLIALIVTIYLLKNKFKFFWNGFNLIFALHIIKNSWAYALAAAIMLLYFKIDVTILSFMTNNERVGLYSAAYNIVLFMNILPSIFLPSTFSIISKKHIESPKEVSLIYRNSLKYLSVVGFLLLAIILPFSSKIITLIYGQSFQQASNSLSILAIAGVILIVDRIGIDLLNAIGKQNETVKLFSLSVIINILLNILLIPHYLEVGSALATLFTEIFVLVYVIYKTKSFLS